MMLTNTRIIPEKLLRELEAATKPAAIRPGMSRDEIMFQAGRRDTFNWLCQKIGINPLDVQRKAGDE